jgi:energy-coupling factor transport system ATP-binding protein
VALISLKDLNFSYPQQSNPALDAVNLTVDKGEFLVLCGRSGSGKSTLLRHLKTVLTPHGRRTGSIDFDGRPLSEVSLREQTSRIGFVLQSPDNQIVTDKVWHELAFGLESLGYDTPTIRLRVAEMASFFGIQEWYHKDIHELSGGQKQLLNLAAIMAMQPDVLILDEPTAQLDPIAAADFIAQLKKINDETGTTVILSEQRLELVMPLADRVAVVEAGRILASGDIPVVSTALKAQDSPILKAFPTAIRVFMAAQPQEAGGAALQDATGNGDYADETSAASSVSYPVTVREGRSWLAERLGAGAESPIAASLLANSAPAPPMLTAELPAAQPVARAKEEPSAGWSATAAPLAAQPVAGAKGIWFRYEQGGADILRGLDIELRPFELSCLLGGNGAGKSTVLGVLAGLLKPYRGKVWLDDALDRSGLDDALGRSTAGGTRARKAPTGKAAGPSVAKGGLCLLPQDPQTVFTQETIRADLLTMVSDLDGEARQATVESIAGRMGIKALLDRHPFDVSVGEQQRAALAKVLLRQPHVLLLDEPTKGLDAAFKEHLAVIFDDLKSTGVAMLMVSHDIEFCAAYADRCALLFDGDIVTESSARRFFAGNNFYTTAANRMSRGLLADVVMAQDIIDRLSEGGAA